MKNFKSIFSMFTVMFILATFAFGQETTGNIEGEIKDAQGSAIVGAAVT